MKTKLFKDNERLINSRSWHYARSYGLDFYDVQSQAYLVFCEALQRFDGRSAFTTYLWHRLRTLGDFCRREKKRRGAWEISEDIPADVPGDVPGSEYCEERLEFYKALDRLSQDGQKVVKKIVQGDFESPGTVGVAAQGKYRVKSRLENDWGWDEFRVDQTWEEIRQWYVSIN
jgi:RNA polymerase sigma factor (sigma-70 family)